MKNEYKLLHEIRINIISDLLISIRINALTSKARLHSTFAINKNITENYLKITKG